MSGFKNKILQARYYEREIEKLGIKLSIKNKLHFTEDGDTAFSSIIFNKRKVAKAIIKDIKNMRYLFNPAYEYHLEINNKKREFYKFKIIDRIVHGVIAKIISEEAKDFIPEQLFSYLEGKSAHNAINQLAKYVRQYKKDNKNTPKRGLYVLRQDIEDYTDSIPVHEKAPLWGKLSAILHLKTKEKTFDKYLWALVKSTIRPEIHYAGMRYSKLKGIPTGSPISTVLYNICGLDVDRICRSINGAFYARYSDDFIFMHPDPDLVVKVHENIQATLNSQGLSSNKNKSKVIYLNAAGRPSQEWQDALGCADISFLGARVSSNGTISLSKNKTRNFLRSLRERIRRCNKSFAKYSTSEALFAVCAIINNCIFNESSKVINEKSASFILRKTTDRSFLKQVDYLIQLMIAEEISGVRGVRAFRIIAPDKLRNKYGLRSIFHVRNLFGKAA